jgi:dihydrofolate synthase / folylpolyglutamate synthase
VNFSDALRYLDQHINLEAVAGRIEGLSLDRIRALMATLGDPQRNYPSIHITGTNGKGSTTFMVSALLHAKGLSVGTYTSPHVETINERIRWNLEPIGDQAFADAISDLAVFESMLGDLRPSYFDLVTAAALQYFADSVVDVAVVEVGVFGRFDATNVIDADVAVITNVGRDHTDGVGDWRRRIAHEKAGIIKPNSLVVLGETDPDLRGVFLDETNAGVVERDIDFAVLDNRLAVGGRVIDLRTPKRNYRDVFVSLNGAHQGDNAALAIVAAEAFFDAPLEDDVVAEALSTIAVPGRFEIMQRNPLVVIDAAHNPEGARVATQTLREGFGDGRSIILVLGLLKGRDIGAMLDELEAGAAESVICCTADSPRAFTANEIAAAARAKGIDAEVVPGIGDALDRAFAVAEDDALILVVGTIYVVGHARSILRHGARGG